MATQLATIFSSAMAVIVPHIGAPPAPVDLPFGPVKPALDPSIPRSALAHALVAAAAVALPLAPALPPHEPEYRLASKRKSPDSDDEPENAASPKRLRADDDAIFGALAPPPPTPPRPVATSQDVLTYTIEQALVAIFQQEATPEPAPAAITPPIAVPLARLATSPLSSPAFVPTYEATEPESVLDKPASPPAPSRAVEPPLWKVACRTRVETIVATYGAHAVRATIAHEAARCLDRRRPAPPSPLKVALYTPSHFAGPEAAHAEEKEGETEETEKTESEFEEDVDMSFDFDDDDDSMGSDDEDEDDDDEDDDEDEDEAEDEADVDAGPGPHESVMDISPAVAAAADPPASTPTAQSPTPSSIAPSPAPPMMFLPRLSNVPVWCLRTYPDLLGAGTPARAAPWACGSFRRPAQVQVQVQVR